MSEKRAADVLSIGMLLNKFFDHLLDVVPGVGDCDPCTLAMIHSTTDTIAIKACGVVASGIAVSIGRTDECCQDLPPFVLCAYNLLYAQVRKFVNPQNWMAIGY